MKYALIASMRSKYIQNAFAHSTLKCADDYIYKNEKENGYNGACRIGKQKKRRINVLV